MLIPCIRLCLDCSDVCTTMGRILSRQTEFDAGLAEPSSKLASGLAGHAARSASGMPITMSIAVSAQRRAGGAKQRARRFSLHSRPNARSC